MDNTIEQPKTELLEMNLDYDGGQTLQEAVRWAKFLAIVSIAGMGLLLLLFAGFGSYYISANGQELPSAVGVVWLVLIAILIYFAAWIVAAIILLRFSRQMKRGINHQDQTLFNRGLKSLKVTFVILGIISCLTLLITLYSIIVTNFVN
jgi:amino acid permease